MLEFFRLAEATRNPNLKDIPLSDLMRVAAEEAGWHLEYISNLQNRTKYQVRYERPFSSQVTAELACRLKNSIMYFLSKRNFDPSTINSYIGYGFWNFIKTYKPDIHNTDVKIKAAIYRSVQNKVDQGNRKEIFKYKPTNNSIEAQAGITVRVEVDDLGNKTETKISTKYIKTPKEISFNTEVFGKDGGQSGELGDFIPDERYSPTRSTLEKDEEDELLEEYTSSRMQEILLRLLVEAGAHGRFSLRALQEEALHSEDLVQEVTHEIEISLHRAKERAIKKGREFEDLHITQEMVNNKVARKTKVFYRDLKKKLANKYSI